MHTVVHFGVISDNATAAKIDSFEYSIIYYSTVTPTATVVN